jgi:hypothetical protein
MRFALCPCVVAVAIFACLAYFSTGSTSLAQAPPVTAGQVIISELRYRGPNGIRDEFIELYNNTDDDITVQATDASAGWSVVTSDGNITGPVCNISNGTIIPARGHFLCANTDPDFGSGYSLSAYPSGNPSPIATPTPTPNFFAQTTPDQTFLIDDIPDGFGIALFSTQSGPSQNAGSRLDAFGFTNSPALFKEGNGFPTVPSSNTEHTLYRDLRPTIPKDTNDNAVDFRFVQTTATIQTSLNGSPGPENRLSPIVNNTTINLSLLDPNVGPNSPPNRERRPNVEPNANLGTLRLRRTFTNNTGAPVSRLRFRIIDITTRGTPSIECGGSICADLRALTSQDGQAANSQSQIVSVRGVRLEENPPITPEGGGLNASWSADFITLATPLPNGFGVNIEFKLGIMSTGPFRVFINIEAQNSPAEPPPVIL